MFKAVFCWVGHLGCKLDEFDHDISTFRKKEDFMVSKQNSTLLPLIFENCMLYQNDQLFQEEVLTQYVHNVCFQKVFGNLLQWILLQRGTLFIVGGGSQFQKRFI